MILLLIWFNLRLKNKKTIYTTRRLAKIMISVYIEKLQQKVFSLWSKFFYRNMELSPAGGAWYKVQSISKILLFR